MEIFDEIIKEIRDYGERLKGERQYVERKSPAISAWPPAKKSGVILKNDTGVELGNPADGSVSFTLWTADSSLIRDGVITLIGPDISESSGTSLPFGRVVILGVNGFNEDNCYERQRDIELMRFDLNLRGYMIRAASSYMKEWSRISKEALSGGASLFSLGKSLIDMYCRKDYIESAEVIFITSSPGDVRALSRAGEKASRLIGAMSKMVEEMSFDCDTCDYADVCGEVNELRSIRDSLLKERG